ncbi:MAG TPA: hypothetical protein VJ505_16615 [Holophagaceae bacterium]|nr:hypothetical protein [Holophagaceae bacterium]
MSVRQFSTVLAGDVAAKALTALLVLGLVRLLQPADFASYVYLSSLVILSATLLAGFFNRHYIMAGINGPSARSYRRLQVGISAALFIGVAAILGRDTGLLPLAAAMLCTVAAAAYDFRRTHAQKVQAFGDWSKADVVRAVLLVLLSAPPIWLWKGRTLIAALMAAQTLAFALGARLLPALPTEEPAMEGVASVLRDRGAIALIGYFALVGLFGQMPILLLKQLAEPAELASFGSAFRYYGLLLGVVSAANVVILPRIAQTGDLVSTLRSLRRLLLGASALVLVATGVAYFIIPYVDGGKYPQAPKLFILLCTGLFPGLVLAPITAIFLRMDLQRHLLFSQVAAVAVCASTAVALHGHGAFAGATAVPAGVAAQLVWLLVVSQILVARRREGAA